MEELNKKTEKDGFWDDPEAAQKVLKEKKTVENSIGSYEKLLTELEDMEELILMAEELEDEAEANEIVSSFAVLKQKIEELKLATLLDGKYDHNNAIISVHAGTGGVDAMDWAQMLLRMYTRWCEKKGYKTTIIDYQDDTEAGIKSATLIVEGLNAYGYLKNEAGVHRLVRISPFNAAGKRQTSFASLEVMPEIETDMSVEID
ncbi:MAG TPA: PCRF domain-containing protein, partial [Anaerovoracaceae bacterium]|nr:PCRF domain-containing protein [Anaerovoracaceae bacterium]